MSLSTFIFFAAGLVLLVLGANVLVKGAGNLAKGWGISSLVIGLTVVAYGTSAPEMAVSVAGAVNGTPDVALGNVLGSTVANVLLILGLSAGFGALVVARRLIRFEVPLMIGLSIVVYLMAVNGVLGRLEALLLLIAALTYTALTVRSARSDKRPSDEDVPAVDANVDEDRPWYVNIFFVLAGIAGLVLGSQFLVNSAVEIAGALGLSELVIGLTVVAVGTSLPEIATSIAAAVKGDRDIAVGNVIGSNIFNLSAVLGLAGLVSSDGIPVAASLLTFDFPVIVAVCLACLPIFFTGGRVMRWEGLVFLAYYAAYVAYLVLDSTGHSVADDFGRAVLFFVLPLTVLTFAVLIGREFGRREEAADADAEANKVEVDA